MNQKSRKFTRIQLLRQVDLEKWPQTELQYYRIISQLIPCRLEFLRNAFCKRATSDGEPIEETYEQPWQLIQRKKEISECRESIKRVEKIESLLRLEITKKYNVSLDLLPDKEGRISFHEWSEQCYKKEQNFHFHKTICAVCPFFQRFIALNAVECRVKGSIWDYGVTDNPRDCMAVRNNIISYNELFLEIFKAAGTIGRKRFKRKLVISD